VHDNDAELALLEWWLRSFRPDKLFDTEGCPHDDLLADLPPEHLRLGRVPQANGGRLRRDLPLPDLGRFAVDVAALARVRRAPPTRPGPGSPS
jgi:xylulose-5-phosphate/fructose-6-phosphate phosphoketolase